MIVTELYHSLRNRLIASGVDTPALDARLLICHVLNMTHEQFILHGGRNVTTDEMNAIDALAQQRQARKPLAKIIGFKEFYGRVFLTDEHTLDPRPDSETLIDAVLKNIPNKTRPLGLLDLGTGTGCLIETLLVELPNAVGIAADLSIHALRLAQRNAERLKLERRIAFVQSDWFEKISGSFDVIISNPPYIPEDDIATLADDVRLYDPLGALDGGPDGLEPYRRITGQAGGFLKPGGLIAFEVGIGQAMDVADMLENQGFRGITLVNDLAGIQRVVLAKRV